MNGFCKFGDQCAYAHSLSIDQQISAVRVSIKAICDRIDNIDILLQSLTPILANEEKIPQIDWIVLDVNDDDNQNRIINISKCEYCHFEFLSQDQLEAHEEKMIAACEECGLCFESEYLSDVHEHDKHTEEYFEVNSLTPTSKRRAYERLKLESARWF